jgi:rhodanese-related sulfurtransferase
LERRKSCSTHGSRTVERFAPHWRQNLQVFWAPRGTWGATAMIRQLACVLLLLGAASAPAFAQKGRETTARQIDYQGFASLTNEVASYRQSRLVELEEFLALAREDGVLLLDARSPAAFAAGHIEGAVNLTFTDFTAQRLAQVIGDPNRRVLIYCNNNFRNDAEPVVIKSAPLALNIPTFINLYGYGYRNIYELGDVVDFNDPRVQWTSSARRAAPGANGKPG